MCQSSCDAITRLDSSFSKTLESILAGNERELGRTNTTRISSALRHDTPLAPWSKGRAIDSRQRSPGTVVSPPCSRLHVVANWIPAPEVFAIWKPAAWQWQLRYARTNIMRTGSVSGVEWQTCYRLTRRLPGKIKEESPWSGKGGNERSQGLFRWFSC